MPSGIGAGLLSSQDNTGVADELELAVNDANSSGFLSKGLIDEPAK